MKKSKFKCIGLTSLLIASKFEDIDQPTAEFLV